MHPSFFQNGTPSSALALAETVDELWPDVIDDKDFVQAALRIVTELFDVPAAVIHVSGADAGWYEYCVTGRQFGEAFLQTTFAGSTPQPSPGERASFTISHDGIWFAPTGVLPGIERWIRSCMHMPLKSADGIVAGSLWLLDARPRNDIKALRSTLLADAATLIVARFQALNAYRYRDRLTHLGNRTQFVRDVRACMQMRGAEAKRPGAGFHAVVIDTGSLPMISGMVVALGLAKVERSIQSMTVRLIASLPRDIRLYKLGHARFGFLLADDIDAVRNLATRCIASFEQPLAVEDEFPIAMSAHAGIVRLEDIDTAADVVSALFAVSERARAAGKQSLMYDRGIAAAQQRAFAIVNSMPEAFASAGQLRLVYQPRERLSDGAWVAAEALIRWRHPQFGELAPADFLPLIESTSLMSRLTDWVIEESVRQLAEWNHVAPAFRVSINVPPPDFARPGFVDALSATLARHRVKCANLEVEITETTVAANPEYAQQTLQRMRETGISVAIDDFGVGYSSLSRWQTFSFDALKIDRALIRDAVDNDRAEAIFQWVISLAKKLGQRVVAEGVETAAQRWQAARWGCDEAQGYFIAHPLEAASLTERLTDRSKHRSIDGLPIEHPMRTSQRGGFEPGRLTGLGRTIFSFLRLR
jgi:EAL domain-containing protein (putative c-di-GMP-specific phosphodiesterase class I)/GGDEF domain-containing protein